MSVLVYQHILDNHGSKLISGVLKEMFFPALIIIGESLDMFWQCLGNILIKWHGQLSWIKEEIRHDA